MVIELPNGATLIMNALNEVRLIFMLKGMSISAEILPPNEELPGSDAWANKEIELYEAALEIDLQEHRKFIADCIINHVNNGED